MQIKNVLLKSCEKYYLIRDDEELRLLRDNNYYSLRHIKDTEIAERVKTLLDKKIRPRSRDGVINKNIKWPEEIIENDDETWVICKLPDDIDQYISLKEYLLCGVASLKKKYMICKKVIEAAVALNDIGQKWMILDIDDLLINPDKGDLFVNTYENLLPRSASYDFSKMSPLFLSDSLITGEQQQPDNKAITYSVITWLFCFLFYMHPMYGEIRRNYIINARPLDSTGIEQVYGTGRRFCFHSNSYSEEESYKLWEDTSEVIKKYFKGFYENNDHLQLNDWIKIFENEAEEERKYDISYIIVSDTESSVYSIEQGVSVINKLGLEIKLVSGRYYLFFASEKYRWRSKDRSTNHTLKTDGNIQLTRGFDISCREISIKFI